MMAYMGDVPPCRGVMPRLEAEGISNELEQVYSDSLGGREAVVEGQLCVVWYSDPFTLKRKWTTGELI